MRRSDGSLQVVLPKALDTQTTAAGSGMAVIAAARMMTTEESNPIFPQHLRRLRLHRLVITGRAPRLGRVGQGGLGKRKFSLPSEAGRLTARRKAHLHPLVFASILFSSWSAFADMRVDTFERNMASGGAPALAARYYITGIEDGLSWANAEIKNAVWRKPLLPSGHYRPTR
jgi:hypothetical protein